ncbi:hypothetical protein P691DRAFT_674729 [Macrolepiota fuliginosa MF-IS2]|uniref:Zn(2)-C6 fungal-type domain-containing protein n=1 Tax=Macrolepiota fuliginosa MF-IS2 TaxID=1400762 RepID=A0A9P6BZ57_9AGAR|nr:hypothetical protein P691DRAFT_674729 [Macrolepiota fuliginosa MF-IS2]
MPPYPSRNDTGINTVGGPQTRRKGGNIRLNCAECRRLKLRCDRAVPCSSCVRRGCGTICSDGSLITGQGNRYVLASTEELHQKNLELAYRIRGLEDALRDVYSELSAEAHPLLSSELLKIKIPLQIEPSSSPDGNSSTHNEDQGIHGTKSGLGFMTAQTSGMSTFYGHTANSYVGLSDFRQERSHGTSADLRSVLPQEISQKASVMSISRHLPDESGNASLQNLLQYLPSSAIAYELRTIYYSHAAWMYNPVSIETFDVEVYSKFYGSEVGGSLLPGDESLAHKLALIFMVFAIGSLMDVTLPAYSLDAGQFHQLARAALFHISILDSPNLYAVQALFLISYYLFLADRPGSTSETRWHITGMAAKVVQSVNRDSDHWNFDLTETQRRRELFWETFTYDSLQSLTFGRPPSFVISHVDCKLPYADVNYSDERAFHAWKHQFTSECTTLLHTQAFGARGPTYATVLQLDKKIRAFPIPPILQVTGGRSESHLARYPNVVTLVLQRYTALAIRETNLLYLHRVFFAKALSEYPDDPLRSPYHDSVMAAYHSAEAIVGLMGDLHSQTEAPCRRMWFLWAHVFSCSIILGSIVIRCPFMSLAPCALDQLDIACELFSKVASGFRATKVLGTMLRLQQKAHNRLEEFGRGCQPDSRPYTTDDNDELAILLQGNTGIKPSSVEQTTPQNCQIPSSSVTSAGQAGVDSRSIGYMQSFGRSSAPNSLNLTARSPTPSPGGLVIDAESGLPSVADYGITAVNTYQVEAPLWAAPVHPQRGDGRHYPTSASYHYSPSGFTESDTKDAGGDVYRASSQELFPTYSHSLNYGTR